MELALKQKIKINVEGLGEEINLIIGNLVSDVDVINKLRQGVTAEVEKTWRNLELLIDEEG